MEDSALSFSLNNSERDRQWNRKRKRDMEPGLVTGILATVLVSLLLLGGFRVITNTAGSYVSGKVTEKEVSKKLNKLNTLIDKYYLYEDEIDTDKLAEGIYSGYTSALGDKYTVYYDEDETKALRESTSGTFSGVGATLTKDADTGYATIVNVYEGSPAEKAGLKAGDILEKIDDHEVGDEQLDTVGIPDQRGKGNRVKITVLRERRRIWN